MLFTVVILIIGGIRVESTLSLHENPYHFHSLNQDVKSMILLTRFIRLVKEQHEKKVHLFSASFHPDHASTIYSDKIKESENNNKMTSSSDYQSHGAANNMRPAVFSGRAGASSLQCTVEF